jgi:hypothetical protein
MLACSSCSRHATRPSLLLATLIGEPMLRRLLLQTLVPASSAAMRSSFADSIWLAAA